MLRLNNISQLTLVAAATLIVAAATACSEKEEPAPYIDPYGPGGSENIQEPSAAGYVIGSQATVFGFTAQNRYAYCPSTLLMPDGTTEMYFCGNPNPDVMIDNVYHITVATDLSHTPAKSVLQPGEKGAWDDQHTCDPSVVKGVFRMGGHEYSYAMFYLGCCLQYYYNEVGVAFADDLNAAKWDKYPLQIVTKGWDAAGDLEYAPKAYCWGAGQPSAISLDKAGKVLLSYTSGTLSGTKLMVREVDFSDMDNPKISGAIVVSTSGLTDSKGATGDYICDADIALEPESQTLLMIRPVQPHPESYPAFINANLDILSIPLEDFRNGYGTWTQLFRITPQHTGYPRNHNACLERDAYGHTADTEKIRFYYTTSEESPDVAPQAGKFAEWTYTIRKGEIASASN